MKRALAFIMLLVSSATWSQAADPVTAVKVLLSTGWEKGGAKGKEAKDLLDNDMLNKPPLSTDPTAQAARWLALMQHDRYPDALTLLETFPKLKPSDDLNLASLRATIWLHAIKQNYPQALIQADLLVQAANPNPPVADGGIIQAQDEAITFLGNIAGFLEGPCGKGADQTLAKFEEKTLQRLPEARKQAFTNAKAATVAQFNKLSTELTEAKVTSLMEAKAEREKELTRLSDGLKKLSEEKTKLENQKQQVRNDFDKNTADLNREDGMLQQILVGLQGQITLANTNVTQIQATLDNLQLQFRNAKDDATRQKLQNDIRQAQNNLGQAQNSLNQLNNQAAEPMRKRKEINLRKNNLDRAATIETKKLEAQLRGMESDIKKTEGEQNALSKKPLPPSQKVLALEAKIKALKTYSDFPLENLRVAWLKKVG